MKRFLGLFLLIIFFQVSCGSINYFRNIYKSRLSVQEVINIKQEIDNSNNTAFKYLKLTNLKYKRVRIKDIVVKDIIDSNNVDYKFCVIVEVPTDKGNIECYIYAGDYDIFPKEDITTISKITKGVTKIDVDGDFSRFFSLLDESFTKIEIINANISICK